MGSAKHVRKKPPRDRRTKHGSESILGGPFPSCFNCFIATGSRVYKWSFGPQLRKFSSLCRCTGKRGIGVAHTRFANKESPVWAEGHVPKFSRRVP
eukprot:2251874-Heterocapsa_arctica.AAC.1